MSLLRTGPRTWLRATSHWQARGAGVITSPSRRGGRVNMRHSRPGCQRPQLRRKGASRAAPAPGPGPGVHTGSSRRTIQGLESPNLPRVLTVARSGRVLHVPRWLALA
jgi:hypothetical protein